MGDLHGKRALLVQWLKWVKFDFENDILLSTGDLIDRGEDSLWCASLIYQPWFHSCHSNHGQMFKDALFGKSVWNSGISYVDAWVLPLMQNPKLKTLAGDMGELPIVLNIKNKAGKLFHIIHAELEDGMVTGDQLQDDALMTDWLARDYALTNKPSILWSRFQYSEFCMKNISHNSVVGYFNEHPGNTQAIINMQNAERGHIISGHTIMQKPLTILNQTCIDTGAYLDLSWAGLTFMDLNTGGMMRSTKLGMVPVYPIKITMEDLQHDN